MASNFSADFRFGDVLRLTESHSDYRDIRIAYIGEAQPNHPNESRRIIAGVYLAGGRPSGIVSTFYADAYEMVDGV